MAKSADLILMVLDASKSDAHRAILTRELEAVGIRLNRAPPQIYFKRKKTGGVSFSSTVPLTQLDEKLVMNILHGAREKTAWHADLPAAPSRRFANADAQRMLSPTRRVQGPQRGGAVPRGRQRG